MTVSLSPLAKQQFVDQNGLPLAGGLLHTYAAGTTMSQPTYTDASGSSTNPNPIVLDASGRASIWLGLLPYKFVLQDSVGNLLWTVDDILAPDAALQTNLALADGLNGSNLVGFLQAGQSAQPRTVQGKTRDRISVKDYGAIGDGVSHPMSSRFATLAAAQAVWPVVTSLTDEIDWAAFQSAINANSGAIVEVPAGTYIINRAISITTSFTTLEGSNQYAPTIITTNLIDDIVRIDCGTNILSGIAIRQLYFDASAQKTNGAGLKVAVTSPGSLTWTSLEHLRFGANMAFGIDVQSAFFLSMNEINILGVGSNRVGLRLAGLDSTSKINDVKISNFKVIAGTSGGQTYGVVIDDFVEGVYSTNLTLESKALDVDLFIANRTGSFLNCPRNMFFWNTICDSSNGNSLIIANCQTVHFTDLWVAGATNVGVVIAAGVDIEIKGITCLVHGQDGIVIGSGAGQVRLLGGIVVGNSLTKPNTYSGITVSANVQDFTIKDIDFFRNGSSQTHKYDILVIAGSSDRYLICDNRCTGGITAAINDGGTGANKWVQRNALYNPRGFAIAQPAVPASGIAVSNTSGTDAVVYITGGTGISIAVGSVAAGGVFTGLSATPCSVTIPAAGWIQVFYTTAPTWKWFGN